MLLCQLELPLTVVTEAVGHAHAHGVTVMLNPSPVQPLPRALLAKVDVLVANTLEVEQLGHGRLLAVRHVETTLGARGARYRGPGGFTLSVPAPKVDAVDTTGAGDAFAGVLAALWNQDPVVALEWAATAGTLSTTMPGAHAPTARQIADVIAAGPRPGTTKVRHLTH